MTTEVGAVLVAYRSTATLPACLASLKESGVQAIIVVDNDVVNCGFARAANRGAKQLTAPYLLFLNPDARLSPGALDQAVDYFYTHPAVGIVGLVPVNEAGQPELWASGPTVTPWSLLVRKLWRPRLTNQPQAVGWVSGVALLIRRDVFEAVHGFDPRFFLYWEDVDLGRRVQAAGWEIVSLPTAHVTHRRGASLSDDRKKTQLYDDSADRYWRKHYPKAVWLTMRGVRKLYRLFFLRVH